MEKTKFLTYTVLVLLLLNLLTIGFLFFNHRNILEKKDSFIGNDRPKPKEIIIERLHFDKQQIAAYDITIKEHQQSIRNLDDSIRTLKNELYKELAKPEVNEKTKITLIEALANCQKKIETTHFNHFQDIKKCCKKEQLEEFNSLTEELSRIFSKPPRPRDE